MKVKNIYNSLQISHNKNNGIIPDDKKEKVAEYRRKLFEATGMTYKYMGQEWKDKLRLYGKRLGDARKCVYMNGGFENCSRKRLSRYKRIEEEFSAVLHIAGYTLEQWQAIFPPRTNYREMLSTDGGHDIGLVRYNLSERDAMIDRDGMYCTQCGKKIGLIVNGRCHDYGQRGFLIPDTRDNIIKYGLKLINARENIFHICCDCETVVLLQPEEYDTKAEEIMISMSNRGIDNE